METFDEARPGSWRSRRMEFRSRPRGLTKKKAAVDLRLKGIAPTTELRKWFGHDPAKWKEFQARYRKELRTNKEAVAQSIKEQIGGA